MNEVPCQHHRLHTWEVQSEHEPARGKSSFHEELGLNEGFIKERNDLPSGGGRTDINGDEVNVDLHASSVLAVYTLAAQWLLPVSGDLQYRSLCPQCSFFRAGISSYRVHCSSHMLKHSFLVFVGHFS